MKIISKIIWIAHICALLLISSLPTYAEFKFNDVEYRIGTSEELNLEVIFKDITLSNNKKSSQFIIGFGEYLNKISQMNLSEYENDFRLPKNVRGVFQQGRFYINDWSVGNGLFGSLLGALSEEDREKVIGACSYLNNKKIINEMVKTLAKSNVMQRDFLERPFIAHEIKYLTQLCVDYTKDIIPLAVDVKVYNDRGVHGEITFKSLINDDMLKRRIAFDADLLSETKTFHAFRIDKSSLKTSLPEKISHKGQPGKFFISDSAHNQKRLRKLYNYVSASDRYFLKSMCKYLTDDQVLNDVLLKLSQVTDDKLAKRFLEKNSLDKHKNKLRNIAISCINELKKIPVVEVQFALKENGYSPGPLDGRWGKKTNEAISNYLRDNEINYLVLFINNEIKNKPITKHFCIEYFNKNSSTCENFQ